MMLLGGVGGDRATVEGVIDLQKFLRFIDKTSPHNSCRVTRSYQSVQHLKWLGSTGKIYGAQVK